MRRWPSNAIRALQKSRIEQNVNQGEQDSNNNVKIKGLNMKLLSNTNSKLKADGILGFGLPPVKTCPGADACLRFCYGCKGFYQRFKKSIAASQNRRLDATHQDDFVQVITAELQAKRKKLTAVRIHDTGDFYSQVYFDDWCEIARLNPDVLFYAYTKSLHLDFTNRPANLKLIGSVGGRWDTALAAMWIKGFIDSIAMIYEPSEKMSACHVNVSDSDAQAVYAVKNRYLIGIYKH